MEGQGLVRHPPRRPRPQHQLSGLCSRWFVPYWGVPFLISFLCSPDTHLSSLGFIFFQSFTWASPVAQMVKNLPAIWETWVWSLDWKDPLEEGIETHSSILAWRISWTEEPGGLQSKGLHRVRHDWETNIFTFTLSVLHLLYQSDFPRIWFHS